MDWTICRNNQDPKGAGFFARVKVAEASKMLEFSRDAVRKRSHQGKGVWTGWLTILSDTKQEIEC